MKRLLCACLLIALSCSRLWALGPHEVLLLVNGKSADSVEIGRAYARLRDIPDANVVEVNAPVPPEQGVPAMDADAFMRSIWTPAWEAARQRGVADQILAWVYSTDFPTTINGNPPISILGLTFLRGEAPDFETVRRGKPISRLFTGPRNPNVGSSASLSFDVYSGMLRDDMPLPAMMLGYTGPRGNTKEEVLACLRRGVASDRTSPSGKIYLVKSEDVRSTSRHWQFPRALIDAEKHGVEIDITHELPHNDTTVMGIMLGAPVVDMNRGNTFLPGAMAEHFTSAAAEFHSAHQTKISRWIAAGATASAGTVTEPYSYWTKFPSSQFYVHYAAGCTMIESFYQALAHPLQQLLLGDPLAQPWAPQATMELSDVSVAGSADIVLEPKVTTVGRGRFATYTVLVDGRVVQKGVDKVVIPREPYAGKKHTVRVVAHRTGWVKHQVFAAKEVLF